MNNSSEQTWQLTISQMIVLKKGWDMISVKPVSGWHPRRSTGFLLRKPFRMEAALTDSDRGIRIGLSRMTESNRWKHWVHIICQNTYQKMKKMRYQLLNLPWNRKSSVLQSGLSEAPTMSKGLFPASISYNRTPKAHQSTLPQWDKQSMESGMDSIQSHSQFTSCCLKFVTD